MKNPVAMLSAMRRREPVSAVERVCSVLMDAIIILLIVLLAVYMLFEPVVIEGSSMEKTVSDGDTVVIRKTHAAPARGSVVVFAYGNTRLIKRVVAVAGDRVGLCYGADGNSVELYLDSGSGLTRLDESYIAEPMDAPSGGVYEAMNIAANFAALEAGEELITVDAGKFIAFGDNRNVSRDSRYYGQFDVKKIVGRYVCTLEKGTFLYSFFSFFYFRGNSATDGAKGA